MKFSGLIATTMSGKMAGVIASHNKGGAYFRSRGTVTNPNTPAQAYSRAVFGDLSNIWSNVLTSDQRDGWKVYSDNVPLTDRTGSAISVGALAMFIRSNAARIQAGLARINDAPTTYNLGTFAPASLTSSTTSGHLKFVFNNTDDWATAVGGACLLYTSRPQNPTIGFFKGPFQYAARVNGAASPPTSPFDFAAAFPFVSGQRVYVRAVACAADGRVSQEQIMFLDAA